MDPKETYLMMFASMKEGDHETAREHAKNLKDWLDNGGFYPQGYTETEVFNYMQSVLRRTSYLERGGRSR